MPVDYLVDLPCEPRRRLGDAMILGSLRLLERQCHGDPADGGQAAAREAAFALRPLAFHCARCPANAGGGDFGCFGVLHGPLTAAAEEWLVGLLPDRLTAPRGREPDPRVRAASTLLADARGAGRRAEVRRHPDGLLLRPHAALRRYGGLFRRTGLNGSQLVELLLLRDRVPAGLAETVCRALGIWVDGGAGEDGVPEAVFTQPVERDDETAVAELKQYFLALLTACSLDVPLRTFCEDGPDLPAAPRVPPRVPPRGHPGRHPGRHPEEAGRAG